MFPRAFLENILFIDIETVSVTQDFSELPPRLQGIWTKKTEQLQRNNDEKLNAPEYFQERAAIFAEFGKPVCVSAGSISFQGDVPHMKVKSFFGENEEKILASTANLFTQFESKRKKEGKDPRLCGHNGKEFDFPYLCRRFLINSMPLPPMLSEMQGKKPWEVKALDTMDLWKFGDYKSYTSLDLLTAVLGIPSPKGDISGADVGRVFWKEKNYERIARYCEQDVIAAAQVMLRFSNQPLITMDNVTILD